MQRQITTQLEVSAPAGQIWAVLTEWDGYPAWNPFIRRIIGTPREGGRVGIVLQLVHGRGVRFRGTVSSLSAPGQLSWVGYVWFPGLLVAEQQFRLEPLESGATLLVQRIAFRGLLVPLMWRSLKRTARRGAMLMNAALKGKVEDFGKESRAGA